MQTIHKFHQSFCTKAITEVKNRRDIAYTKLKKFYKPLLLDILIPVYNESKRMECLRDKLDEMSKIQKLNSNLSFRVILADDGSNDGTLKQIHEIISDYPQISVFISEISVRLRIAKKQQPLAICMGAAMIAGYKKSLSLDPISDYVVYTDFDFSVPIWQIGNMLSAMGKGVEVIQGSRRAEDSLVLKSGKIDTLGKEFIKKWKEIFPEVAKIISDTNGPLRACRTDKLSDTIRILDKLCVYSTAFKVVSLVHLVGIRRLSYEEIGLIFLDQEFGSHFHADEIEKRKMYYLYALEDMISVARKNIFYESA